jgi:hypothetical protein
VTAFADNVQAFWSEIAARPDGPFAFRFYLQPAVATLLALRDGIKDAREGDTPYFWTLLHDDARRGAALREGLHATGRVILLGIVMDAAYQYFVLGGFRPLEMIVVVLLLCFLPYLFLRGVFTRMAKFWMRRHPEARP